MYRKQPSGWRSGGYRIGLFRSNKNILSSSVIREFRSI